jgi:hypothetical protein
MLALSSLTSGVQSDGIVRLQTKATEFSFSSAGMKFGLLPCGKNTYLILRWKKTSKIGTKNSGNN